MASATDRERVLSTTLEHVVDADQGLLIKQTPSLTTKGGDINDPCFKGYFSYTQKNAFVKEKIQPCLINS